MTFAQVWTFLRWPLAILGLLVVAQYALSNLSEAAGGMIEFDASGSILAPDAEASESEGLPEDLPTAEPQPSATLAPGTGPVTDGASTATADFHVEDIIADVDGSELTLGDGEQDAVVVAFDIPAGDPGCMAVVNLSMGVTDVASATEIGIFASAVDEPAEVRDNQEMAADLRAFQSPMQVALITEPATLVVDLTAGFQDYFIHGFPEGRDLVLTIMATVPVEPLGGVSFESIDAEDGEAVPTLLWTGDPECAGA
ncbi:MAG TPA: hypothetical protein VMM13_20740 [Euzebya sp.]|nr:hypothetical protein [Euzebya sp.]